MKGEISIILYTAHRTRHKVWRNQYENQPEGKVRGRRRQIRLNYFRLKDSVFSCEPHVKALCVAHADPRMYSLDPFIYCWLKSCLPWDKLKLKKKRDELEIFSKKDSEGNQYMQYPHLKKLLTVGEIDTWLNILFLTSEIIQPWSQSGAAA